MNCNDVLELLNFCKFCTEMNFVNGRLARFWIQPDLMTI